MLEQVIAAFEKKDYRTAANILKKLLKESPSNPWVHFYVGRLNEVSGKHQEAEKVYRRLLRDATNNKLISQSRQGLRRLQDIQQAERQQAIAVATSKAQDTELGVLVLEPISNELKKEAAQKFAQVMQIDAYSARLLLPSRGWRFYRSGAVGELQFYGEQLKNAGIPCFWQKISAIQEIKVFQVEYFTELDSKAMLVCRNDANQLGSLSFDWLEVKARVLGLLPIFEEVIDVDARGKLARKTKTQDYFQFYDLHLPARGCILRLYDNGYDFKKGLEITPQSSQNTIRINWNGLTKLIDDKLSQTVFWSDFTPFAETILDQNEMLSKIDSHIHLFRREITNWDTAFQLYSGLIFVNAMKK